jgi:hypothetical protein
MKSETGPSLPRLFWEKSVDYSWEQNPDWLTSISLKDIAAFSKNPVKVSADYILQMNRLCEILNKSFEAIVAHYFSDSRIRDIYQLDAGLENILQLASTQPYQVGFFRPDLLFDQNGQAKICEIGARYPLNGWILSFFTTQFFDSVAEKKKEELNRNQQLQALVEDICGLFPAKDTIALLHDQEKGTEVFYFKNEFQERGFHFIQAKPQDLVVKEDTIYAGNDPVYQFIFEMDREELRKFRPEVLEAIVSQGIYFNDIRTLILIHDKRVLVTLFNEAIMRSYLSAEEYAFLRPFLINSQIIQSADECQPFIDSPTNLILKRNSGGRGVDAYVKNNTTPEVWEKLIRNEWTSFMIQEYVHQYEYADQEEVNFMHLIGMLLCYNGRCYGPGIFRGSDEAIINVHQGRGLIYPVLIS